MSPETADLSNRQPVTIGLLSSMVRKDIFQDLWWGVMDSGQAHGISVICLPGGELPDSANATTHSQANIIYDLASTECLDGLIIWSRILGWHSSERELQDFINSYRHLPIVTVERGFDEIPAVLLTEFEGIQELMEHLVTHHNYQRIAHIRGPSEYEDDDIFRAYKEALDEYGLFDPKLVTPPVDWGQENGAAMIALLMDERGLTPGIDIEAILAADDALALGAINALQDRGIHVPHDVAVVGFDDTPNARSITPALTTVRHSYYDVGKKAVDLLLEKMRGGSIPDEKYLPAELVIRQSCGCLEPTVAHAAVTPHPTTEEYLPLETVIGNYQDELAAQILQIAGAVEIIPIQKRIHALLEAFKTDSTGVTQGKFLLVLEDILRLITAARLKVSAWQDAISLLHQQTLPYLTDRETLLMVGNLWQQARVLISKTAERAQRNRVLQTEQRSQSLREVGQRLIRTFDAQGVTKILAEGLRRLSIPACYLSLYENPQPYQFPQSAPEWSELILAYNRPTNFNDTQSAEQSSDPIRFPSHQLVPDGLPGNGRACNCIVEPLYFGERQIGFVLFEVGPREGGIYDTLRGHLSTALQGAQLLDEALKAKVKAEKADQLKTRLLANVSHELRAPLNVILGYTWAALHTPDRYDIELPAMLHHDFQQIHDNAEHQIRVINDLLDLSRAEIDELDLYPELIDPSVFLQDVFDSMAPTTATDEAVIWRLRLPTRLPMIQADPVRLRQILLNLLSNARKFTERGEIILGADVQSPYLHIWVQDSGIGIPSDHHEKIFEPFTILNQTDSQQRGIGLGLTITRHLILLHSGSLQIDSVPGRGSTFHAYFPLPSLSNQSAKQRSKSQPILILISSQSKPSPEILDLSRRNALSIQPVTSVDEIEEILLKGQPEILAWDVVDGTTNPVEWAIIQRLRKHPLLNRTPFVFYKQPEDDLTPAGMTNLIMKPVQGNTLLEAINLLRPETPEGPLLIVDDDPKEREYYQSLLARELPLYPVRMAEDGMTALEIMSQETPSLVILDLMMPEVDGFEVLAWMRTQTETRQVPVLVLSNRLLSFEDIQRLENYSRVTVQSKGLLSTGETVDSIQQILQKPDKLSTQTSALVKRATAYFHQNYQRSLSRQEMADALGVSEDYLGRVFRQELNLSPWEYLKRYRIKQAKVLLVQTENNITEIAHKVGFDDSAYFSRVFRKVVGQSPRDYRKNPL